MPHGLPVAGAKPGYDPAFATNGVFAVHSRLSRGALTSTTLVAADSQESLWGCPELAVFCRSTKMVPRRGLEPPRPCERQHLKLVRLPIPPPGHGVGRAN